MKPKALKISFGRPLGSLLGPLGTSWAPLGAIFEKKLQKIIFYGLNLGAKMEPKIEKNDVKKELVSRYVLLFDFLRFLMELGPEKQAFLNQFLQ